MDMKHWTYSVKLAIPGKTACQNVSSTMEAADCLFSHWPKKRGSGRAYVSAMNVIAEVMDGRAPASDARSAFITAALEADIEILH
jgi:hypothetical protein